MSEIRFAACLITATAGTATLDCVAGLIKEICESFFHQRCNDSHKNRMKQRTDTLKAPISG
jgi:hypothetical protein